MGELIRHPVRSYYKVKDRWYETTHPDHPMLAPRVIEHLEATLSPSSVGFEWGSGGSTVWFARHCGRVVSVEHSDVWYQNVLSRLEGEGIKNVDYRHVALDHPSEEPTYSVYPSQPEYVAAIEGFEDRTFDFCLVDGHYRQACVLASVGKLKLGGLLIVDDTQRMPQAEWGAPAAWEVVLCAHTGLKETTVWRATT